MSRDVRDGVDESDESDEEDERWDEDDAMRWCEDEELTDAEEETRETSDDVDALLWRRRADATTSVRREPRSRGAVRRVVLVRRELLAIAFFQALVCSSRRKLFWEGAQI